MLDLPKKTLFFHSVFSLRYCAALENTNCLRYRPDDSSAIPELTVAAGDTAVPELVADRRARALWTKVMKTLIITFHTLVLAEEGGREVRLSRRFSMGTTGGQATFAGWPARLLRDGKIQRQLARLTMP